MSWLHYAAWFWGGAFFMNSIPHLVAGISGRAFQTPFANPPGKGKSSSMVNVAWGTVNCVVSYLLLLRVGSFDFKITEHAAAAGLGALVITLVLAKSFGEINGGNLTKKVKK